MKVTPVNKKFGKYVPGDVFDFPDKPAKVFIKLGKLEQVNSAPTYQTRMMQAEPVASPSAAAFEAKAVEAETDSAPYGYKADGTPRKRPGRAPAAGD